MKIVRAIAFIVLYLAVYVVIQLVSQRILYQVSSEVLLILNNGVTLIIYWLLLKARKRSLFSFCRFKRTSQKNTFIFAPMIGVALGTVIYSTASLPSIREQWPQIYSLVEFVGGGSTIWLTLLGTVLVGSLFEEVLFRGLIFNELRIVSPAYIALAVQAILFGLILMDPILGSFAALGALVYGVISWASQSLWASLITHIFSSGTVMFWLQAGSQINDVSPTLLFTVSLVGLLVLLVIHLLLTVRERSSISLINEVSK